MTTSIRVPLLLQPANPPLPFVGRVAESARLIAVIERGPIAVVCGFSGVGKSGLLTSILATRFAEARDRTLVIDDKEHVDVVGSALQRVATLAHDGQDARPTSSTGRPTSSTGRPTSSTGRATSSTGRPTSSTGRATSSTGAVALVEALEAAGLWLLVENLERIDGPLRDLLTLAQRFCRNARVLCVCREDPRVASLAPHTVTIGPMSTTELRALLDEVQPGLSETEAAGIVAHAKGSPWRLRQLSMGGAVDDEGPEKSLLMLAPIAVGVLRTLALVPSSIPIDVLARATRMPSNDVIEALARRGYLEMSARGVRLHDAARPLVDALFDSDERSVRASKLVRAIVDGGSADLGLAAIAMIRETRDVAALSALLDKHGASLRADGHATALLDIVTLLVGQASAPAMPALDAWQLLLALDVGGDALARVVVREGPDVDAPSLALRAAGFAARGELARACAAATKALEQEDIDAHVRLRALDVLLRARDDDADRALLARIHPDKVTAAEATWHAALANHDARQLPRMFDALAPGEQLELAAVVARALRSANDPRAASAVLATAQRPHGALSTSTGRAAEIERGHAALALADLAGARVHFARAASFPTALEQVEARLGALAVRLTTGELRDFDVELASVVAVLRERETPPFLERALKTMASSREMLAGRSVRTPLALDDARRARARSRDAGLALQALDGTVDCIDAAIIAGDLASVTVEAEQLAATSAHIASRRFALDARFASLVAARVDASAPLSPTALVELAQVVQENPIVARRAAALLGESVALDDVDRAVLASLSAHAARPQAASVVNKAAGPEWTVDARSMHIILVDGSTVDLSHKKVLFDLLATLCANGGAATKEQLLERAWGVREYHPLHHDNRLKVAVRKLRRLLEEILGADPIETAPDGYRLRGKVRFLK